MALDPMEFMLLRRIMARGGRPSTPSNINIKIDLSAVRDLWGRKQNEDEDESPEAQSSPVHVTNLPRISPG